MKKLSIILFAGIHLVVLLYVASGITAQFARIQKEQNTKIDRLYDQLGR